MLRWITYHLSSCEDSRCQGKSWTLWPAWLWPLSWFELGSDRCSQPVPLGSPLEHRQRTSWHTVPMLDTKNKQKPTDKDGLDHQEKQHAELQVGSHLICSLIDSKGTGNLWSSSTIYNTVVFDQVTDHTECIMEGSLCLFNNLKIVCTVNLE